MQYRHLMVRPAALAPIRQALGGEGHSRGALLAVFGASWRPVPGADRCSPASHRVGCSAAELELNIPPGFILCETVSCVGSRQSALAAQQSQHR